MFGEASSAEAGLRTLLASNLRRARVARRVSLSELARDTGLGKATLSDVERGRANPTVETLRLLAEALGLSVSELLRDHDADDVRVVRRPRGVAGPSRRVLDRFAVTGTVEATELVLPAGHREAWTPGPPGAREELLVLQGTLVAGPPERATELGPGDWASFPADVGREVVVGRHAARVLLLAHG